MCNWSASKFCAAVFLCQSVCASFSLATMCRIGHVKSGQHMRVSLWRVETDAGTQFYSEDVHFVLSSQEEPPKDNTALEDMPETLPAGTPEDENFGEPLYCDLCFAGAFAGVFACT